ncbi:hypothetical protein J7E91_12110 [Streptomyces sp. ISL-99]|uniref:glycoside hydrolase family 55 protein n=1 Tax=Streptomyces sp. ISL-99 TaxID=2819193 RepID=UPI001BE5AC1F|nr:glycoside hydrolase family 55 protein [Streptomyces sp. ISL-99]MBT2526165.1 hypothetical protein [Streptomyces sp. ISL-99]
MGHGQGQGQHTISRRGLLSAIAVAAASTTTPAHGTARQSSPPPTTWQEFTAAPYTHPQIPYVGRAGAHAGARRAPRHPVVANVLHYGAKPDSSADAAPAINRALAAAGARGGGTVVVPPGTYRIDDVIRIGHSNVVLRGAGSTRTKLLATRNLTELIGPYGSRYGGDKSSWSWAGGLIWLCPQGRYESLTAGIRAKAWPFEGWTGNKRDEWRTLTTVAPAERGDRTITVHNATRLHPGRPVLLRLADDATHTLLAHIAGDSPGAHAYTWDDKTKLTSYVPYEWPVRITRVTGTELTLERPLPLDIRPEWDPSVEDFAIAQRTTPPPAGTQLHGINVEGLSSYNVWSRGVMHMGTFDTHRGMPFANVRTQITVNNNGRHGGDASAGPLYGARFTHWNVTVTNARAGLVKIDTIAPYSATVGISEVREFDQTDVPDFTGPLHSRLEAYGSPTSVHPPNLYEAQRALTR